MAQASTIKFGKMAILISDGATPTPNFGAPCGLTTLGMNLNIAKNDTSVPDCADPDLPSWVESEITTQQMVLTGSGVLDRDALADVWQPWWHENSGEEKMVRWYRNLGDANAGYFEGPAILTQYSESGQQGQRYQVQIEITFNGKPTWVPQPA